ncbi:MAG: hypothetical protein U0L09_08830, partial [Christensenellales bacterium]|nr:hypothetical protein [Christensenellales bacterium]
MQLQPKEAFEYVFEIEITQDMLGTQPTLHLGTFHLGQHAGHPVLEAMIRPEYAVECRVDIKRALWGDTRMVRVGEEWVDEWEITNEGNVDIVNIVINKAMCESNNEEAGYMQMKCGLEKPLAPGETTRITTHFYVNEKMNKETWDILLAKDYYSEDIEFAFYPECGSPYFEKCESTPLLVNCWKEDLLG